MRRFTTVFAQEVARKESGREYPNEGRGKGRPESRHAGERVGPGEHPTGTRGQVRRRAPDQSPGFESPAPAISETPFQNARCIASMP